jgi:hypothetical protein
MKIRVGLAGIIGMLCLMVGVIAGGRAATTNGSGELAAGELTVAGATDDHDHDHADGEGHDHADGDDHDHADGEDHDHADGDDHAHDPSDPNHAHDPSDPNHPHDPNVPHDPSDPNHPHPTTPTEITYTDEQLDLLRRTQNWIYPRYANVQRAIDDGYSSIGDSATGFEHYVNGDYLNSDTVLDPRTVESLVYEVRGRERILVSAMYILPIGDTMSDVPAAYTTPQTPWHIHTNLCWSVSPGGAIRVVGTTSTGQDGCPPGSIYFPTPPMLHVWLHNTPCGWFADLESFSGDCNAHPH